MNTENRKIDSKTTMQLVVDNGWHQILKVDASRLGKSLREHLETFLIDYYEQFRKDNLLD